MTGAIASAVNGSFDGSFNTLVPPINAVRIIASEAFADRRYEPNGSLRSRTLDGALITNPMQAAQQAADIATGRGVFAGDVRVAVRADTICIHSDTPGALGVARAVRNALEKAGFAVRPPKRE